MRPRLLDLFCGAGGSAVGYWRAGFDVVGVDINPQPRYPFVFVQGDALEFLQRNGRHFDAIHASPPCQRYSAMSVCRPGLADKYPDLVGPTRDLLNDVCRISIPYVIENVPGSPVRPDITLCGFMFDRELYRHRIFESNYPLRQPDHPRHTKPGSRAGHWEPGQVISVSGHCSPIGLAREVMGIDWMNRAELAESIPPYYAEHIGEQLIEMSTSDWAA